MAIVQQGGTSTTGRSSGSTSLTITKPTGVAAGDVLIAGITCDGTTPTAPSGWTQFGGGLSANASWHNILYYRVVTGSEGANFTWTTGSAGPAAGFINAWRGVDNASPIDGFIEGETTTSSEPNTTPTATISVTGGHRMHYVRCVRDAPGNGTATAADLTEASATASRRCSIGGVSATGNTSYTFGHFNDDADSSGSGSYGGLAITCNISEDHNYEATYALKVAGTPSSGDLGATIPAVTSSFAATREIPSGAIGATISPVSSTFTGTPTNPEGAVGATLAPITSAFAGNATGGPLEASLAPVSSAMAGGVEPSGAFASTLAPITSAFGSETRQFGEHVIKVEAEHRAFLVIDDDPGLKPIPRSQVWVPVIPTVNALAGEVVVGASAHDSTVSTPLFAAAGHAAVVASAFGADISTSKNVAAGTATISASVHAGSTSLGANSGTAIASAVVASPVAASGGLTGSATASVAVYGPSRAVTVDSGTALASVTANSPTVSTSDSQNAPAGVATASVAVYGPSRAVTVGGGAAAASVAAHGASSASSAATGAATASTSAYGATVSLGSPGAFPATAQASASAYGASAAIATSSGTALVRINYGVSASSGSASASASAYGASVRAEPSAGPALASATAYGVIPDIVNLEGAFVHAYPASVQTS